MNPTLYLVFWLLKIFPFLKCDKITFLYILGFHLFFTAFSLHPKWSSDVSPVMHCQVTVLIVYYLHPVFSPMYKSMWTACCPDVVPFCTADFVLSLTQILNSSHTNIRYSLFVELDLLPLAITFFVCIFVNIEVSVYYYNFTSLQPLLCVKLIIVIINRILLAVSWGYCIETRYNNVNVLSCTSDTLNRC